MFLDCRESINHLKNFYAPPTQIIFLAMFFHGIIHTQIIFLVMFFHGIIHLVRTQNFSITSSPLIGTRTWAYQGVRNVSFLENFGYVLNA